MKNFVCLFVFITSVLNAAVAQKSKSTSKTSSGLASLENVVVDKKADLMNVFIKSKSKEESITLSDQKVVGTPKDVSIKSFTADNTKMFLITWTEMSTTKTDLKLEEVTTKYSKIINPETKAILFSNYQKTNHITEKVFLDKLKNASETQEKMRREGFEFTLNADGSITQKNKTQENKWIYKASESKFVDVKRK